MSTITWYKSLKSTNSTAREMLEDADNMSVVACREQSAGRGQGTHTWFATPGRNLTFSIIFKPENLEGADALYLTRVTTMALLSYLQSHGIQARIKWPNDIWVEDRKICGILIESIISEGKVIAAIIGIGLNINERDWPSDLPNPVSLSELTGRDYDIKDELETFLKEFCRHASMLDNADGRTYLCSRFEEKVFRLPEAV